MRLRTNWQKKLHVWNSIKELKYLHQTGNQFIKKKSPINKIRNETEGHYKGNNTSRNIIKHYRVNRNSKNWIMTEDLLL